MTISHILARVAVDFAIWVGGSLMIFSTVSSEDDSEARTIAGLIVSFGFVGVIELFTLGIIYW